MKIIKTMLSPRLTYLLALITTTAESRILRNSCGIFAKFDGEEHNVVLQGAVIETLIFTTKIECKERCIRNNNNNNKCRSINYEENGQNVCELNSMTVFTDEQRKTLTPKDGWTFITTDHYSPNVGNVCQKLKPCNEDEICFDTCNCPGYECRDCSTTEDAYCKNNQSLTVLEDCNSLLESGLRRSGIYFLVAIGENIRKKIPVYCEMETANHGWTIIQRRSDNKTSFDRLWNDYKNGFGDLSGSFWLGLDNIHTLTNKNGSILRIELIVQGRETEHTFAEYSFFRVGNEASNYLLEVRGYQQSSTLNDGMTNRYWQGRLSHNMRMFSTKDRENDPEPISNCAEKFTGGWWFSECYLSHLNGAYYDPTVKIDCEERLRSAKYITWFETYNCFGGILFTEMKIRRL